MGNDTVTDDPSAEPRPVAFGLHLVTLAVADLDRAAAFYASIGLVRHLRQAPGVAFFGAGNVVLSLYPRESLAQDVGTPIPEASGAGRITLSALGCSCAASACPTSTRRRSSACGSTIRAGSTR